MRMQPVAVMSRQPNVSNPRKSVRVNRSLTQSEARAAKPMFAVPVTQPLQGLPRTAAPSSATAASAARTRGPEQYKGLTADRFLAVVEATAKYLQGR